MASLLMPGNAQRKRGASSSEIENNDGNKKEADGVRGDYSSTKRTTEGEWELKKKTKEKAETPSTDKKTLAKCGVNAKKRQDKRKLGNEEQKERYARQMVKENCKEFKLIVHNTTWPWLSKVMASEDGNTLHLLRNQVNHNTISKPLTNEITNNFAGNPIMADLNGKIHDRSMGDDMICILTHNTLVSVPVF